MTSNPAVCGNSVIEDAEACDPPAVGSGCSAQCKVENGWTCPQPGVCFKNPACGDNIVQVAQGEGCDPPNVGNGCTASCKVEAGWTCVGLGPSICVKPVCGNGAVDPGEQCDDGSNTATKDGCSGCVIGAGWACPTPGASCIPKCGDGMKVGIEQCDDGNKTSGDGCNTGCKLEAGFTCPTAGAKCVAAVCGDKNVDTGEGCDDGNKVAGDGCGPTCQPEPTVTVGPDPKVNVFCGDGLVTGAEKCDDGNTNDGDGCEHDCTVTKPGWTCTGKVTLPPTLDMRINFRDFKSANALTAGGHPDFQYNTFSQVLGITGDACLTANAATCGRLDAEGKPVLVRTNQQNKATGYNTGTGIMSAGSFGLWYRDTNPTAIAGNNGAIQIKPFTKTLTLVQQGGVNSDVYAYSNGNFYPITAAEGFGNIGGEVAQCNNGAGVRNQANSCNGCDANCMARDYGFTSELRYFFQYKGGERLTFTGDDDVWVYVNGKLAVDLGGLHSQLSGQVVLGDDGNGVVANDSNCSANGVAFAALPDPAGGCYSAAEQADSQDQRFGLTKGGVYEIVLFHAERHSDASNFRLTLAGFLAPRSSCSTICGDGLVAGDEYCDDGPSNSDAISGACNTSCTARAYCGDSVKQLPGEACDNGTNTDLYKTSQSSPTVCAPGCKVPASCGDGALQAAYEQCDKGLQNNDASYGKTSCTTACKLGGYCGDGIPQTSDGEACDLGANNGKTYGPTSCGYDCQPGPRCGDHIRNGGEQCDDGPDNGKATSHCDTDCTIKPYCGDGIKQVGEECDYGQFASTEYGGCTDMCMFGPRCGDGGPGDTPDLEEECDRGTPSNTGGYDGCTNKCTLGPRCGDSITQAAEGEACDNGFNADDYDDPNTPQAECGPDCTLPPHCGDGRLQPAHELCDNGQANDDEAYEGCTTKCDFGPYCGDGNIDVQGGETCDNGRANVSYAAKKGGCSYDCQPAPYCGDAQRNGPEQCDLGAKKNTGAYGGCNADCTFAARCGDGKRQGTEECDDGPSGSLTCSATCKRRVQVQ
jgi:fibro-slime domain-containing protein